MTPVEILAIVVSLVALVVTVIGFFASLKFYRDGVSMNTQANRTLAQIEEKAVSIQTQVGGIFDKTLDAALGRTGFSDAQRQQRAAEATPPGPPPEALTFLPIRETPVSTFARLAQAEAEPAASVTKYFMFRKLRLSSISVEPGRALFSLGVNFGFNLFDGVPGFVFFGYFPDLDTADIVARVRSLFASLELAYKNLSESPQLALAQHVYNLLNRVSVELLVPEAVVDADRLRAKIDEFQPAARSVEVVIRKPSEVQALVAEEYQRMKVE